MIELPVGAELVAPRERLAFLAVQSLDLGRKMSALEGWLPIMADPLPGMRAVFAIRDAISARFGVKRIGGLSGAKVGGDRVEAVKVGDRLDFFLIETLTDEVMSLSARDRHLDVLTSVTMVGSRLSVVSSVVTHNLFGRIYLFPVGPAHRLIVRWMLARLRRRLEPFQS